MPLSKRIIARLDVKGSKLIKGIRFEGLRVLGDLYEAALKTYISGVDEILYIDTVASLYGRNSLSEILLKTSRSLFIPITAGGGIRTVADARNLLASGADKVAINTASILNPKLITKLAEEFGSQSIVASIQARRSSEHKEWTCMVENGRERTNVFVLEWIKKLKELGAGEILITSVDQDGTAMGPDKELIEKASAISELPIIFGAGISTINDIEFCLGRKNVSAVSLATALHKEKLNVSKIKIKLEKKFVPIRISESKYYDDLDNKLSGLSIGIIDYGMGNQQSLINSLKILGASVELTSSKEKLKYVDLLALPGVGSFPRGMSRLKELNILDFLKNRVSNGHPLIGVCLGMQMLFQSGNEFKYTEGLGFLNGTVKELVINPNNNFEKILPHIGWNQIYKKGISLNKVEKLSQYFVHSYAAQEVNEKYISYICKYSDKEFVAAVRKNNIAGFQFHPERSGIEGLNLLSKEIIDLINNK